MRSNDTACIFFSEAQIYLNILRIKEENWLFEKKKTTSESAYIVLKVVVVLTT